MKDYYKILGIEKSASKDEVKKAFRKLTAQYHPDKKTGDEARYKEITEAYGVLGDTEKRAQYDTYGQYQAGGGNGSGFQWPGGGFGGAQGFEFDLNDIFENFGDMFGGGGRSKKARGRDISIDVELEFSEAVFGTKRSVLINKHATCETCSGSGAKPGTEVTTCTTCNGQGRVREVRQSIMGSFQTVRECQTCHGSGKIPKERCSTCHGDGVVKKQTEINFTIPSGIEPGEMIRLSGQGEAVAHGQTGDLYVKIHVRPHPHIKRDGTNLLSVVTIKLTEALLGKTEPVVTLDGTVDVKIPAGITHGELLRIKGKGVPIDGRRGDFFVKINIEMPKHLSRKVRKLIEDLQSEGI